MTIQKSLLIITLTTWSGLGFFRGINSYKYNHNKYEKKEFLYSTSISYGFCGVLIYLNPIFFPIISYKEMYRLEVHFRKLVNEKKYRLL
jgi:hypothetical protein